MERTLVKNARKQICNSISIGGNKQCKSYSTILRRRRLSDRNKALITSYIEQFCNFLGEREVNVRNYSETHENVASGESDYKESIPNSTEKSQIHNVMDSTIQSTINLLVSSQSWDRNRCESTELFNNPLSTSHSKLWRGSNHAAFKELMQETQLPSQVLKYLLRYYAEKKRNHNQKDLHQTTFETPLRMPSIRSHVKSLMLQGLKKEDILARYKLLNISKHQLHHIYRNLSYKKDAQHYKRCKMHIEEVLIKNNKDEIPQDELEKLSHNFQMPLWKIKTIIWRIKDKCAPLTPECQSIIRSCVEENDTITSEILYELQKKTNLSKSQLYQQVRKWKGKKQMKSQSKDEYRREKERMIHWLQIHYASVTPSEIFKSLREEKFQLSDTQLYHIVNTYKKSLKLQKATDSSLESTLEENIYTNG